MGIWAESYKTLKFNNSMLRGKTLFKVINENSSYKYSRSTIKAERMDFGLASTKKRRDKRTLIFFLLIYPAVVSAFIFWIISMI